VSAKVPARCLCGLVTVARRCAERRNSSERRLRVDDATNADEARTVRRASQLDDLNSSARVRCMHHAPAADVDADVSEPGEEEQVPGLHPGARYAAALVVERVRAVWNLNAQSCIGPVDEPGAVEAARRRGTAPSIRHADLSQGDRGRALADGGLWNPGERSVPSRCLPSNSCGCIVLWKCASAGEDDRGKSERQQTAAKGGRHEGERTTGRRS
jgi:hypothetical protein